MPTDTCRHGIPRNRDCHWCDQAADVALGVRGRLPRGPRTFPARRNSNCPCCQGLILAGDDIAKVDAYRRAVCEDCAIQLTEAPATR